MASSLVTVVLDLDERRWAEVSEAHGAGLGRSAVSLGAALESVLVLLNAVKLIHRDNEVAVVGACADGTAATLVATEDVDVGLALERGVQAVGRWQADRMTDADDNDDDADVGGAGSSVAVALARALCRANRLMVERKAALGDVPQARVLVLQASPDEPGQYIACMNAAFAAQKQGIVVDVCDFCPEPSTILRQVAHLSGGILQRFSAMPAGDLTEHLLAVFLADVETRKLLKLPPQAPIVLEAACFCCGELQARGFVCSVCLSVFCKDPRSASFKAALMSGVRNGKQSACPTCKTRVLVARG